MRLDLTTETIQEFKEMAELIKDHFTPSKGNPIAYLGLEHIEQQTLRISSIGKSSDITSQKLQFKKNDILFGKLRPYFRKVVRPNFDGICSTDIFVVRAKKGISQSFLYYVMASNEFVNYSSQGTQGTKMPRASWDFLEKYEQWTPALEKQEKIGKILSDLDAKIQNLQNQNKILEQMAQAIFKSWFVDFDGVTEFEDSELGKIPKGWSVGKIKDVIEIFDEKRIPLSTMERVKRKGIIPYYGATTIIDFVDDHIFDGKFLLLGEDGSVVHDDGTPFIQYVSGKFWVNNHAHVMQGKNSCSTEFVYLFFKNLNINPWITGAVQLKVNQSNLLSIPIIIANPNFLKKFNQTIFPIFSNLLENEKSISILTKTRDALLPKLMSGEIRV